MANPNAKMTKVDFKGPVNLNKNKALITPFVGFNRKNSPLFGGSLSPVYHSKKVEGYSAYASSPDHEAYFIGRSLYADGEKIFDLSHSTRFLTKEEILGKGNIEEYFDDNVYLEKTGASKYTLHLISAKEELVSQFDPKMDVYQDKDDEKSYVIGILLGDSSRKTFRMYRLTSSGRYKWKQWHITTTNDLTVTLHAASSDFVVATLNTKYKKTFDLNGNEAVNFPAQWVYGVQLNKEVYPTAFLIDKTTFGLEEWEKGLARAIEPTDVHRNTLTEIYTGSNRQFVYLRLIRGSYKESSWTYTQSSIQAVTEWIYDEATNTLKPDPSPIGTSKYFIDSKCSSSKDNLSTGTVSITPSRYDCRATICQTAGSPTKYFQEIQFEGATGFSLVGGEKEMNKDVYEEGVYISKDNGTTYQTPGGKRAPLSETSEFNVLLNEAGFVQGLSFVNADGVNPTSKQGVLLTHWNTVSSDKIIGATKNSVCYFDESSRKWYKIIKHDEFDTVPSDCLSIIGDYIIINIGNADSVCYNLNTKSWEQFASDWNNRLSKADYMRKPLVFSTHKQYNSFHKWKIASAIGVDYPSTGNPIASAILPEFEVIGDPNEILRLVSATSVGLANVDLFFGGTYWTTCNSGVNPLKDYLKYPVGTTYYNIGILFSYVNSYSNNDVVSQDGTSNSLLYFNNKVVYLYTAGTQLDNLTASFVIQGQVYGVVENKIITFSFQNNVVVGTRTIVDVSGLKFIAATPYQAFFWSPSGKTLFSFKGDNMIYPEAQADGIDEVYSGVYNPSTGSILVSTSAGVLVISPTLGTFVIDDIGEVTISLSKMGVALFSKKKGTVESISYVEQEGYVPDDLVLETTYYGEENNISSVVDCWYFRLFDDTKSEKTVKLSVKTLTDVGCKTEEKTFKITPSQWDKDTSTFYLKYQPKLQRGVGVSLKIVTNARISDMYVSSKPDAIQLSHNNY